LNRNGLYFQEGPEIPKKLAGKPKELTGKAAATGFSYEPFDLAILNQDSTHIINNH